MIRLTHVDSPDISFRELGSDFRWVDCRRFAVRNPGNEREILAALIGDPWYDFSYSEPTPSSPKPGANVHGPFQLEGITPQSFIEIERADAIGAIETWAQKEHSLPPSFFLKLSTFIAELLPDGHRVFELAHEQLARHEWGQIVGVDGFLEFVSLSPDHSALNFLVASDD